MKILCVLLSNFPLKCEFMRHPELQGNIVITYTAGSQKRVFDYSPRLDGLQRDMSLQQALSLHGDVELVHADMPYYQSVFKSILDALEEKSPLVDGTDLGEIYIGLDGLHLLYPTDDTLIKAVRDAMPAIFDVRMGIASGKFYAYLAALYSPAVGYRTLRSDIKSFLNDLSCDVLPVSAKSKSRLHEFGLHTLGQIARLKPGPLQSQFGPEGKKIWALATGYDSTPLNPRLTEEVIEETTTLPSLTVRLDVMMMALESMLSHAFTMLAPRGMGINSIGLWTRTCVSENWERKVKFKEPVMNTQTAISRIKRVMENSPQPGPVEQIGMKVTGLGRQNGRQSSLFSEVRAQEHLLNDIRQMEFQMGSPQLFRFKEVEPWSRIPERRHVLIPLSQ